MNKSLVTALAAAAVAPLLPMVPASAATPSIPAQAIGSVISPESAPSAAWITNPTWASAPAQDTATPAMPLLARDVNLRRRPVSAHLTMAGVGLYTPTINGHEVSTAVLQPGATTWSRSVEYRTYDVTPLVGQGSNRIGVELGTGIYDEVGTPGRYRKGIAINGALGMTARLNVTYDDGSTAVVDTSQSGWKTKLGATTGADWYGGEDRDARRDDKGWNSTTPLNQSNGWSDAVTISKPVAGSLFAQKTPPTVRLAPVAARSVSKMGDGSWLVDMGDYYTGQPQVSLSAPRGTTLRMYPAENLRGGVPSQASMGAVDNVYDSYTFAGSGIESWHPKFDYHGFRYLHVTGVDDLALTASNFSVVPVRTVLPAAGRFTSDSPLLTELDRLTTKSLEADMQALYTDCPNREKLGWLEQSHLLFDMIAQRYDVSQYMSNIVHQIVDSQASDGRIPEIAPETFKFSTNFTTDPNWSGAVVTIPWQLYRTYGDLSSARYAYPAMKRYVDFVQNHPTTSKGIVTRGLGDWITTVPTNKNISLSMGHYRNVDTLAKVATALGNTADAAKYRSMANSIKAQINASFYSGGSYGPELTSNAMAVVLGITPDAKATNAAIVNLMTANGNTLQIGEIGLGYLFDALHDMGRDDILWSAMAKTTSPGFGYFAAGKNPALPEYWNAQVGSSSLAHVMLAYPGQWEYKSLAGIDQTSDSVAFSKLLIKPAVNVGPTTVSASRVTPKGTVSVSWTRTGSSASVTVTVPNGSTADVVLPGGTHHMAAGTKTFASPTVSSLTTNASVVSGPVVKAPWSTVLYGYVNGYQRPISYNQWQALGSPLVRTKLPNGSIVKKLPYGGELWVRLPDGTTHHMTAAEWKALGYPSYTPMSYTVNKYSWAAPVYMVGHWNSDKRTWQSFHLSGTQWRAMGHPAPSTKGMIPGSKVVVGSRAVDIVMIAPDGGRHLLTPAEWVAAGQPRP